MFNLINTQLFKSLCFGGVLWSRFHLITKRANGISPLALFRSEYTSDTSDLNHHKYDMLQVIQEDWCKISF